MRRPRKAVLGCCVISCNQAKLIAENGELQSLPRTWEMLVNEVGPQHCAMKERDEQGSGKSAGGFLHGLIMVTMVVREAISPLASNGNTFWRQ